uniref:Putative ASCH domain-containing protein n=2 Tax=viral metagenome TaxID=1070528 RepID=A0A6M3LYE8_9ZZZZ
MPTIDWTDFRALTVRQPWASAIVSGSKRVENRTWPCPFRQPRWIAIHAGRAEPPGDEIPDDLCWPGLDERSLPLGAMVGLALVKGSLPIDADDRRLASPWASGPHCWLIRRVIDLAEPVPCRGALSLWRVPAPVVRRIKAQVIG